MQSLLNIYKPICLTPLQVIDKLREEFPEYKDVKIGYAGRLDPLAHGVLLLMIGEETKQRKKYLDLPKEYEFEAVFGLETDTYDLLGLCKESIGNETRFENRLRKTSDAKRYGHRNRIPTDELKQFTQTKLGPQTQPYPPYSSKAVGGKPLHWWAKKDRLFEITIPTREINIYNFELLSTGEITAHELHKKIIEDVSCVSGDFRQKKILEKWDSYFNPQSIRQAQDDSSVIRNLQFKTARFKILCSSGTYVRGLVHELGLPAGRQGQNLGCGAVTTEILRTKVGDYTIDTSLRLTF